MRYLMMLAVVIFIVGCKKMADGPTIVLADKIDTTSMIVNTGNFQNGPYGMVSGMGSLYKNADSTYSIILENFNTSNGPDLYVYLSKQPMPIDFIDAGKLRSTMGRQIYILPGKPDVAGFKYISIHCKAFNHLFGYATLP